MALVLSPVVIAAVVSLWFVGAAPTGIAVWSAAAFVYFAFFAPSDCLAVNRNGTLCRDNAKGLLRSCHRQQHKRQNMLRYFRSPTKAGGWLAKGAELFNTPRMLLATTGAAVSLLSGVLALLDRAVSA